MLYLFLEYNDQLSARWVSTGVCISQGSLEDNVATLIQGGKIPSSLGQYQSFFLFLPSTCWMRPTHIKEDNLFFLKSAELNVNLLSKILLQQHLD